MPRLGAPTACHQRRYAMRALHMCTSCTSALTTRPTPARGVLHLQEHHCAFPGKKQMRPRMVTHMTHDS
eukprot:9783257-Alexandrium_andersonii.AAC.1